MGQIGMPEIIVIAVVVLILFGAKRLPEIGSSLGKAIREFKKASRGDGDGGKDSAGHKDHDAKPE
ncbi:MAG: twin-arginine translocase TatA/TatE family subunit [Candidatus Omnitrophica bacterium]|nr:twin-arginine translocase TatA/TatE family subunit [Candidatus Omnitrophota bacterium]